MRNIVGPAVATVMAIFAANCSEGCKPVLSAAELNAAYTAEILGCTERAGKLCSAIPCPDKDKPAAAQYARLCRHDVNRRYGLCEEPWPAVTPCDD